MVGRCSIPVESQMLLPRVSSADRRRTAANSETHVRKEDCAYYAHISVLHACVLAAKLAERQGSVKQFNRALSSNSLYSMELRLSTMCTTRTQAERREMCAWAQSCSRGNIPPFAVVLLHRSADTTCGGSLSATHLTCSTCLPKTLSRFIKFQLQNSG